MRSSAHFLARLLAVGLLAVTSLCYAAEKPRIHVDDYVMHVVVTPQNHQLKAQTRVKFTALEDINVATFELHNALRPTRVLDAGVHQEVDRARDREPVGVRGIDVDRGARKLGEGVGGDRLRSRRLFP